MIRLTRLQGDEFMLNAEQILYIERTPDTTLVLLGGQRTMVQESPEEVVDRVVAFRRRLWIPEIRDAAPPAETERSAAMAADEAAGELATDADSGAEPQFDAPPHGGEEA